jgi:hypothetical protein
MKTALLQYPIHSSIKLLNAVLVKRGFSIISLNDDEGTIRASTPGGFFKKPKMLDIKVQRIDQHSTRIDVSINSNKSTYEKPQTNDEFMEEKLVDTIYHYF